MQRDSGKRPFPVRGTGVCSGYDMGNGNQHIHAKTGHEGYADLRGGNCSADFFLYSGIWMDSSVGSQEGLQQKKISFSGGRRIIFPVFRNCGGGIFKSEIFTADSAQNVIKNIEISLVLRYTESTSFG